MDAHVLDIASCLWEALDTPTSLGCYLRAKHGEWDSLASMRVDPSRYLNADSYFRDCQSVELLRKSDFLPLVTDRKKAAYEEFRRCESVCCETNSRLERWVTHPVLDGTNDHFLDRFIKGVKRRIKKILGPLPKSIVGKFGPGSTFESRGSVTLGEKIQEVTCTTDAVDLLKYVEETAWGRSLSQDNQWKISVVPGNRFTTVPKDAVKDRGICIEPGVNVFLQLGVGKEIRARLQRVGIDLDDGQSQHRLMAMLASRDGGFATIDLSSASDMVCYYLVRLLLPPDWFSLLNSLRSKKTLFQGKWHWNQKFSSMGNGFTFELETLLFYAISKEACRGTLGEDCKVLTYGDDILVPACAYKDTLAALKYFGFEPNMRKSFGFGYFRESCGGDYFNGVDVRPFYLKECPHEPSDWFSFHNGLVRLGRPYLTRTACRKIISRIPRRLRSCVGPSDLGDIVLHMEQPKALRISASGVRTYRAWVPIPFYRSYRRYSPSTQLALALYGCSSAGLQPRDSVSGFKVKEVNHLPTGFNPIYLRNLHRRLGLLTLC